MKDIDKEVTIQVDGNVGSGKTAIIQHILESLKHFGPVEVINPDGDLGHHQASKMATLKGRVRIKITEAPGRHRRIL